MSLILIHTTFGQSAVSVIDLVHPGDLIEIDVLGGVDFDVRGRPTPEGFLEGYQLADGSVFVRCRSVQEIADDVARRLGGILRKPEVEVRILDRSRRPLATVIGAVKTQQRFMLKREVRVTEILVLSGGLTDMNGGVVSIFRPAGQSCRGAIGARDDSKSNEAQFIDINVIDLIEGKVDTDIRVFGGDLITVREAFPVYVVGGVNNPRNVQFRTDLTVTRAISSAGGPSNDANIRDVVIYRRTNGASQTIAVDLEAIKKGAADDVVLEKNDVVDVARRGRERRISPMNDFSRERSDSEIQNLPVRIVE